MLWTQNEDLKHLWAHNCEASVDPDKRAFMWLKSEGRVKKIKKEGGEEVK